jgi:hypothetical protein
MPLVGGLSLVSIELTGMAASASSSAFWLSVNASLFPFFIGSPFAGVCSASADDSFQRGMGKLKCRSGLLRRYAPRNDSIKQVVIASAAKQSSAAACEAPALTEFSTGHP